MTQVDFYILSQTALMARLHYACRLAEKAFHRGHHVVFAVDNPEQGQQLSEVLWSFKPESFLPHHHQDDNEDAPLLILWDEDRDHYHDILINLGSRIPEDWFSRYKRVFEIVVQDEECLKQTREHFKFYRHRGYPLQSHKV